MFVPVYDRAKVNRSFGPELEAAVLRALAGDLDADREVTLFEAEFAAWNGASHAVSVNSGTAAILAALLAVGVRPGDEVITVPNTDGATSSAVSMSGAGLVWVDVDPVTRTMSVEALEAALTPRTRAIVAVDMFGHPADIHRINALAARHGIPVVEDACLAPGAMIDGVKVGAFATATCFSFGRNKHLGAIGAGGCVLAQDGDLAERLRMLSGYGEARERSRSKSGPGEAAWFWHETIGLNQRLDEIQAAILRVKLPSLASNLECRRAQARRYEAGLAGTAVEVPRCRAGVEHAWRNYVVEVDDRDAVRARLAERGVGTNLCYTPPMHLQPAFAGLGRPRGSYPVAEAIADRLLGLPIGPHMGEAEQDYVIERLRECVGA